MDDAKKFINIGFDPESGQLNMDFSENLDDGQEIGYILSSAFLAFSADQGVPKENLVALIQENYDDFLENSEDGE